MVDNNIDWDAIDTEYITTNCKYSDICKKYNIGSSTMARHGKQARLVERRAEHNKQVVSMALRAHAEQQAQKLGALISASDKLAGLIDQALSDAASAERLKMDARSVRDLAASMRDLATTIRDLNSLPSDIQRWEMDMQERKLAIEQQRHAAGEAEPSAIKIIMGDGVEDYAK